MKGFSCFIYMSVKFKYSLVLLLICGLCFGKKIQKCFTERKMQFNWMSSAIMATYIFMRWCFLFQNLNMTSVTPKVAFIWTQKDKEKIVTVVHTKCIHINAPWISRLRHIGKLLVKPDNIVAFQ